jgi:hypothetical protein
MSINALRRTYETLTYDYNTFCKSNYFDKDSEKCTNMKNQLKQLKKEINRLQENYDTKLAKSQAKKKKSWFSFGRNDNGYKRRSKKRSRKSYIRNKSLNLQKIYNNYCKFNKIEDEKLAKNKRRSKKSSKKRSKKGSKRRSRKIN